MVRGDGVALKALKKGKICVSSINQAWLAGSGAGKFREYRDYITC